MLPIWWVKKTLWLRIACLLSTIQPPTLPSSLMTSSPPLPCHGVLTHEEGGDRFREIQTVEEVESEDDGSSGGVPYWINSLLIHFLPNQLKAKPNLVRPLQDDSQLWLVWTAELSWGICSSPTASWGSRAEVRLRVGSMDIYKRLI